MARPRIFTEQHDIHVYLHKEQKDWITKKAHDLFTSPSAIVRGWIDNEMKFESKGGSNDLHNRRVNDSG